MINYDRYIKKIKASHVAYEGCEDETVVNVAGHTVSGIAMVASGIYRGVAPDYGVNVRLGPTGHATTNALILSGMYINPRERFEVKVPLADTGWELGVRARENITTEFRYVKVDKV